MKKFQHQLPHTRYEAAESIRLIGETERSLVAIEQELNATVSQAQVRALAAAEPLHRTLDRLVAGVHAYLLASWDELAPDGRRTIDLGTGIVRRYLGKRYVWLKSEDKAVEQLEDQGLDECIRTAKEVDRNAVLADPSKIAGLERIIRVKQDEFIAIKPTTLTIEVVAKGGKIQKRGTKLPA